jgi:acylphosphatase
MKHLSIRVSGKVQGVFFRASTKEMADQFQIKGTVRNNPNGSVSIEAEGEDQNMDRFVDWCRHGPRRARVDEFEMEEAAPRQFKSFVIER